MAGRAGRGREHLLTMHSRYRMYGADLAGHAACREEEQSRRYDEHRQRDRGAVVAHERLRAQRRALGAARGGGGGQLVIGVGDILAEKFAEAARGRRGDGAAVFLLCVGSRDLGPRRITRPGGAWPGVVIRRCTRRIVRRITLNQPVLVHVEMDRPHRAVTRPGIAARRITRRMTRAEDERIDRDRLADGIVMAAAPPVAATATAAIFTAIITTTTTAIATITANANGHNNTVTCTRPSRAAT